MTKAATEAKAADNARKLEERKEMLLDEALLQGKAMHTPAVSRKWHEGVLLEWTIPEPTFTDQRNIAWTQGGAIRNFLAIDAHQGGGEDLSEVDSWLDTMAGDSG